jgi:2-polyprenyl-6-hydroxyphenyl methylase/3-demethylubiquinone-9 3-methyltransferase
MAALGARVTGIDMGTAPLAVAKLHLKESGHQIEYLQTTAEALVQERRGAFDVVTCLEMLEHVPDPAAVVRACAELVRPGGTVFFSTINRNPKSFLFAIVGAEYVLNLLPRGTHEYRKFIKPSELDDWAREAGLMMREFTGMHYNPIARRYWLAPGVDVNYLAYTERPNAGLALRSRRAMPCSSRCVSASLKSMPIISVARPICFPVFCSCCPNCTRRGLIGEL